MCVVVLFIEPTEASNLIVVAYLSHAACTAESAFFPVYNCFFSYSFFLLVGRIAVLMNEYNPVIGRGLKTIPWRFLFFLCVCMHECMHASVCGNDMFNIKGDTPLCIIDYEVHRQLDN